MSQQQQRPAPFTDGYLVAGLVVIVITMAGVAIWGNDVQAGRFFLSAGPLALGLLGLMKLRHREIDTVDHRQQVDDQIAQVPQKVIDTLNGKTARLVDARVAELLAAAPLPNCDAVAEAAAERARLAMLKELEERRVIPPTPRVPT